MKLKAILLLIALFVLVNAPFSASAQTTLTPEQKAQLEKELEQVEEEQRQAEKDLASAQAQSSSISKDIAVLSAKIKVAQLNIRQKTLLIETLGKDIKTKEKKIGTLEERIDRGHDVLGQIMRKTNEIGSYTMPEILLAQTSITGFFNDIDTFESVQDGLKVTFDQVRSDKSETEAEKSTLGKRRDSETDARILILQEEKSIKANEAEKKRLLSISKGNEVSYQADLAKKRARAAEIRAALFPLRDSDPIKFEDAYKFALQASKATGVRASFILGIFAQESSIDENATFGKHIGSCYVVDETTGSGKGANTGSEQLRVMHPTRDIPPFKTITAALGRDPFNTRVSCWQPVYYGGAPSGWGGAMGAAQFIPSTWILYVDRLKATLGLNSMPSPWNAAHAFTAASLLLKDNGAAAQTYTAERNAACKYFSGHACDADVAFYGNGVMTKAEVIQRTMIDPLQGL
ncbi:MAG: hypothetical protein M3Q80_00080 [bacterium]|nr:hypothetical protein [bacterium]